MTLLHYREGGQTLVMCHWGAGLLFVISVTVKSETESIEDTRPYTFSFSNPSTLNFQDIYTSIVTSAEETSKTTFADEDHTTSTVEDVGYDLIKDKSQFVEFHPLLTTEPPTQPPPKYILNSTFLQRKTKMKYTTTTEEPDDLIKVVPMKKVERGVLDLLFPETRVKSFKNIFDTIKKMLSHTF